MFRHILIPIDGSPLSEKALKNGLGLAKSLNARVTVLTVVEPFHVLSLAPQQLADTDAAYKRHAHAAASAALATADRLAQGMGVPYETLDLEHDDPHQAIVDTAEKKGCDLIAMSSHGRRGMAAVMLGSVTAKVLTRSSVPVLVYR